MWIYFLYYFFSAHTFTSVHPKPLFYNTYLKGSQPMALINLSNGQMGRRIRYLSYRHVGCRMSAIQDEWQTSRPCDMAFPSRRRRRVGSPWFLKKNASIKSWCEHARTTLCVPANQEDIITTSRVCSSGDVRLGTIIYDSSRDIQGARGSRLDSRGKGFA